MKILPQREPPVKPGQCVQCVNGVNGSAHVLASARGLLRTRRSNEFLGLGFKDDLSVPWRKPIKVLNAKGIGKERIHYDQILVR